MFSSINSDFLIDLLLMNGFLILCFLWINHNYDLLVDKFEEINITSKTLDERQKRILKRCFPFYKKLSPNLQRLFEQRLLYFFYMKRYETAGEIELTDRMKLFLSAYAAQVSLGFKEYGFSHIYNVTIHIQKFYSENKEAIVCWELDQEGNLHLSWKDFFDQLNKKVVLPIGLEMMAHAIKKEDNESLKNAIYVNRSSLYFQPASTDSQEETRMLFKDDDFKSKDDFFEACIKNYYSYPLELKNNFPDLFKKIDKLFYNEIKLT